MKSTSNAAAVSTFHSKPYAAGGDCSSLVEKHCEKAIASSTKRKNCGKTQDTRERLEIAEKMALHASVQEQVDAGDRRADQRGCAVGANVFVMRAKAEVGKEVIAEFDSSSQPSIGAADGETQLARSFRRPMIEGELFGYVKAAFTGAMNDFPGNDRGSGRKYTFLDRFQICR